MMKKIDVFFFLFLSFFLFLVIPGLLLSEEIESGKSPHRLPKATSKVKIDGILGEKVWEDALVLELNYEVEPGENIKPPVKTEVLLTYSSGHLYAAFRAYDPNTSEIRARFTDRDNIWEDDYVGIVLDTFNDSRCTYNFYCNPLGIQAERTESVVGGRNEWDAIWNSAGGINKNGYIVEMAIPLSSLRFQRQKEDQVWGIDAIRRYPRSLNHLVGLFPRDRDNNCYMCQAEKIIGFEGAKPGKNIELAPTLSAVLTQERESFPAGKFDYKTRSVDPGLTARWRFTPNLTLIAAANPDFSNVEADAAQLDVNNQFVLYYPEKRPFFLEDPNIFQSAYNVIYTRRVADPDWGIKLTGKEGSNSIGFFSVNDNQTTFVFPSSQASRSVLVNMQNQSTALRYRRDVGKSSALGFLVTDREGDDYFNRVIGIDGSLRLTRKDTITFQWLNSWNHYPDAVAIEHGQSRGNLKGSASILMYRHNTERFGLSLDYQNITPGYRADLGTNEQVDFEFIRGSLQYTFRRNPGYWYTRLNFAASYRHETDQQKNLLDKAFNFYFNYEGPAQSFLNLNVNVGKRSFMGKPFDENYLSFNTGIRPSGSFYAAIYGISGDRIDYANVQAGTRLRLNPIVQYKTGPHFTFIIDHVFEKLNVESGRLYTANLSNFRMVYQFNRRTFLRTIFQYADYKYNPDLYSFTIKPVFRHFFSQVLFSYKINPQTVLFLGYSDDYYGYNDIPLKQNNRTLFLKVGYALVL